MKHLTLMIVLLLSLVASAQIYEPFSTRFPSERQRENQVEKGSHIYTKDVKENYSGFEAFLYIITGTGTISDAGTLITYDDYEAYLQDDTYRTYIDQGGKGAYNSKEYEKYLTPITSDYFLFIFLIIYTFIKIL